MAQPNNPRQRFLRSLTPATASTSSDSEDDVCSCCMNHMSFLPLTPGPVMEEQEARAQAVILHSSHMMCRGCAEEWLKTANTCPHCRTVLFPDPNNTTNGITEAANAIAAAADAIGEVDQHVDSIMLQEQSEVIHLNVRHLEGDPFAQDYIVLPHFTPFLIALLRQRLMAYVSDSMLMDYEYDQYSPAFSQIVEIGPTPHRGRVVTKSTVVDVWAWWANRYHSTLAYGWWDKRHHPVAIQLFLGLLDILRCSVNSRLQPQAAVIKACLLQVLQDIGATGDFEDIIDDLATAVVLATAGELSPRSYSTQRYQAIYDALFA